MAESQSTEQIDIRRKFVIDRAKWRCEGHGQGITMLLNTQGYRCCLGFVANQCGVPDEGILDRSTPIMIEYEFEKVRGVLLDENLRNTQLTKNAMNYNDGLYSDKEREEKLIALFLEHGFVLEFTGEYENA